ncbi:hypothetical protein F7R13_00460 [Burkholderia territorii]|uniref:Kelch-like protein n=2 Tax=Burkholderia territorii TaxID=1503055 RepID=A0A6L3NPX9_9BURK|nr:hypothetical protein F7R13_00460 [Burkholderia territorii]
MPVFRTNLIPASPAQSCTRYSSRHGVAGCRTRQINVPRREGSRCSFRFARNIASPVQGRSGRKRLRGNYMLCRFVGSRSIAPDRKRSWGALVAIWLLCAMLSGCGGGVNGTSVVPAALIYSHDSVVYPVGQSIEPNSPRGGGAITEYSVKPALPPGLNLDPATGVIFGTPTSATDTASYTVTGTHSTGTVSTIVNITVVSAGKFTPTGNMATARAEYSATLLPNGKVLVVGGADGLDGKSSAELYDPITGEWLITGSLATPRHTHTATLLPNGKVLVTGGADKFDGKSSAELYDPITGTWSATGSMAVPRYYHSATLLPNGKVLVAGGFSMITSLSASAELYDPSTGMWSAAGNMTSARGNHTATLLADGKVLVAGGSLVDRNSAELYDPNTGIWSATGRMGAARLAHTAAVLPGGKVLVTGGRNQQGAAESSAELYDPGTGMWSATGSMAESRYDHSVTLLPSGKVLVAGGVDGTANGRSSAELYDPGTGTWSATGGMASPRYNHTATLLHDGKVLVAAGGNGNNLSSAELYEL